MSRATLHDLFPEMAETTVLVMFTEHALEHYGPEALEPRIMALDAPLLLNDEHLL